MGREKIGQQSNKVDNMSLVSIVTPSYNQGRFIEETILSVKNQDCPNIEHIIADRPSLAGPKVSIAEIDDFLKSLHAKAPGIEHMDGRMHV